MNIRTFNFSHSTEIDFDCKNLMRRQFEPAGPELLFSVLKSLAGQGVWYNSRKSVESFQPGLVELYSYTD